MDSFHSEHVRVHFDTGNISMFQFPEHWAKVLGNHIEERPPEGVHEKGTDFSLLKPSARCSMAPRTGPLLPTRSRRRATKASLTFEYFHPYPHYPGGAHLADLGFDEPHPRPQIMRELLTSLDWTRLGFLQVGAR